MQLDVVPAGHRGTAAALIASAAAAKRGSRLKAGISATSAMMVSRAPCASSSECSRSVGWTISA